MGHVSISQPITGQKDKVGPPWVSCSPGRWRAVGPRTPACQVASPLRPQSHAYTTPVSTHAPQHGFYLPTQGPGCSQLYSTRNPSSLPAESPVPTW